MCKKLSAYIAMFLLSGPVLAAETCSRTATINHQEILVDTNSTQKGEGLRYYLEKDPEAKSHLDIYQKSTRINWQNAAIGTTGTLMLISGLMTGSSKTSGKTLIIGGSSLLIINFLVARTIEHANEVYLFNAIEEYNKRNLPKIYFNPSRSKNRSRDPSSIYFNKIWSF